MIILIKWLFVFSLLIDGISAQEISDYGLGYGTYQLSDDCLHCLKEDSFAKQRIIQEQESKCLQQELQRVQKKFDVTLDFIIYSMNIYSKNDNMTEDIKKSWKERISYLKKSSAYFINFVEKFCTENRQLYGVRRSNLTYFYEMIDFLNTRLHHLQNEDLNVFSALTYQQLDDLFTAILDGILTSSKNHQKLSDQENQKIDIFLQLSQFLSRPEFQKSTSTLLLHQLKNLYTQENNRIALALYKKFQFLFLK